MDKMMKLWKELMRCFKGISQTQVQDKNVRVSNFLYTTYHSIAEIITRIPKATK